MPLITPPIEPKSYTGPLVALVFVCVALFALCMAVLFSYFIEGIKHAL